MTKQTSRNRRFMMSKNSIMMLVMLVVVFIAIWSWFSFNKTVSADSISVKSVSTEIDVAECIKTYDNNGAVLTDGPGIFGSTLTFGPYSLSKDCTGDGETLIVPEFNVTNDKYSAKPYGKEVNENLAASNAVSSLYSSEQKLLHPNEDALEYHYIQCEFYARSKNKDLLLSAESQLLSKTEADGGNIFTPLSDGPKKSENGNFNVDGVVGAIRFSLIGEGCTSCNQHWNGNNDLIRTGTNAPDTVRNTAEKQILWLPRPDVYLQVSTGDSWNDWTLEQSPSGGTHSGITYHHSYYQRKTSGTGVELVDNVSGGRNIISADLASNGLPRLGTNFNVSDFTYTEQLNPISGIVVDGTDITETDSYYVTKYTMKVWIEGTDAEARRAMDGGEFSLNISFM